MLVRAKSLIYHQKRYINPGDEVDISEKALARLEGCYERVRLPAKKAAPKEQSPQRVVSKKAVSKRAAAKKRAPKKAVLKKTEASEE